jgi:anti-sigma factor RsiW
MSRIDCHEFRKFVDPYLDGEFDARERSDFDAHVAHCSDCRGWFEQHRDVQAAIRDTLERPAILPGGARARIRTQLTLQARPARTRQWFKLALPVPALAAVASVFIFVSTSGFATPVLEEAVAQHRDDRPLEVPSPKAAEIDRWFADKVSFPVEAPRFHDDRAVLLGGRLSRVPSQEGQAPQRAAFLIYGVGAHKMTVLVFEDKDVQINRIGQQHVLKGHTVALSDQGGYRVAVYRHRGVNYTITSDLPQADMLSLIGGSF